MSGRNPASRVKRLLVSFNSQEREDIQDRADSAGLSVSAYLRACGLNHPIQSVYDHQAVRELVSVAGDLGRFGGLLKLWLQTKRGEGASVAEVNEALKSARALQDRLRDLLGRV